MNTSRIPSRYQKETPEGISLGFTLAHPLHRGLALIIDLFILSIFMSVVLPVLYIFGKVGDGLISLIAFLTWWGYFILFEWLLGASPGKRFFNLYVISETGVPLSLAQSILRNLLRSADMLPALFGFGLITILFHPQNKRLGDIVAGTLVISRLPTLQQKHADEAPFPMPITLSTTEQKSITLFAEYAAETGRQSRAEELASILAPVFNETDNTTMVTKLKSYAAWIKGS